MILNFLFARNYIPLILLSMIVTSYVQSQTMDKEFPYNSYVCYHTSETIIIDGQPTERAWNNAKWSESFVDIEGPDHGVEPLETKVKMLWDSEYFYIYAELMEPHVWGTLTDRDAVIFQDDDFEIFIDPDGDGHNYYEFEVNALNTLWELILLKPYRADNRPKVLNNWNIPNIQTAIHINGTLNDPSDTDHSWSVEWAIPWSALKELSGMPTPPMEGDQWRVNFSRVDWDMEVANGSYVKMKDPVTKKSLPEHNWVWQATGKINMHMPEEWGYVQVTQEDVMTATVGFSNDPDVYIKQYLWKVYLAQLKRINSGKAITESVNELNIEALESECKLTPQIASFRHGYNVEIVSCITNKSWVINSEGRLYAIDNTQSN